MFLIKVGDYIFNILDFVPAAAVKYNFLQFLISYFAFVFVSASVVAYLSRRSFKLDDFINF